METRLKAPLTIFTTAGVVTEIPIQPLDWHIDPVHLEIDPQNPERYVIKLGYYKNIVIDGNAYQMYWVDKNGKAVSDGTINEIETIDEVETRLREEEDKGKMLGEGSNGKVRLALDRKSGEWIAVKVPHINEDLQTYIDLVKLLKLKAVDANLSTRDLDSLSEKAQQVVGIDDAFKSIEDKIPRIKESLLKGGGTLTSQELTDHIADLKSLKKCFDFIFVAEIPKIQKETRQEAEHLHDQRVAYDENSSVIGMKLIGERSSKSLLEKYPGSVVSQRQKFVTGKNYLKKVADLHNDARHMIYMTQKKENDPTKEKINKVHSDLKLDNYGTMLAQPSKGALYDYGAASILPTVNPVATIVSDLTSSENPKSNQSEPDVDSVLGPSYGDCPRGTPNYMAPEIYNYYGDKPDVYYVFNKDADIYSSGIKLAKIHVMITNEIHQMGHDPNLGVPRYRLWKRNDVPNELYDLIEEMLIDWRYPVLFMSQKGQSKIHAKTLEYAREKNTPILIRLMDKPGCFKIYGKKECDKYSLHLKSIKSFAHLPSDPKSLVKKLGKKPYLIKDKEGKCKLWGYKKIIENGKEKWVWALTNLGKNIRGLEDLPTKWKSGQSVLISQNNEIFHTLKEDHTQKEWGYTTVKLNLPLETLQPGITSYFGFKSNGEPKLLPPDDVYPLIYEVLKLGHSPEKIRPTIESVAKRYNAISHENADKDKFPLNVCVISLDDYLQMSENDKTTLVKTLKKSCINMVVFSANPAVPTSQDTIKNRFDIARHSLINHGSITVYPFAQVGPDDAVLKVRKDRGDVEYDTYYAKVLRYNFTTRMVEDKSADISNIEIKLPNVCIISLSEFLQADKAQRWHLVGKLNKNPAKNQVGQLRENKIYKVVFTAPEKTEKTPEIIEQFNQAAEFVNRKLGFNIVDPFLEIGSEDAILIKLKKTEDEKFNIVDTNVFQYDFGLGKTQGKAKNRTEEVAYAIRHGLKELKVVDTKSEKQIEDQTRISNNSGPVESILSNEEEPQPVSLTLEQVPEGLLLDSPVIKPPKKPFYARHPILTAGLLILGTTILFAGIAAGVTAAIVYTGGVAALPLSLLVGKILTAGALTGPLATIAGSAVLAGAGSAILTSVGIGLALLYKKITGHSFFSQSDKKQDPNERHEIRNQGDIKQSLNLGKSSNLKSGDEAQVETEKEKSYRGILPSNNNNGSLSSSKSRFFTPVPQPSQPEDRTPQQASWNKNTTAKKTEEFKRRTR